MGTASLPDSSLPTEVILGYFIHYWVRGEWAALGAHRVLWIGRGSKGKKETGMAQGPRSGATASDGLLINKLQLLACVWQGSSCISSFTWFPRGSRESGQEAALAASATSLSVKWSLMNPAHPERPF